MKFEDTMYTFLQELDAFDHHISCLDLIWDLIFPENDVFDTNKSSLRIFWNLHKGLAIN